MPNSDDQSARAFYAAELGEEWTEVEPGIWVRVDREPRLQTATPTDAPDAPQFWKGTG